MAKETYAKKLRDPRWQKKRLEILERDRWSCQVCGDNESTLHVHHFLYSGSDPWDTPNSCLGVLCESCHEWEHKNYQDSKDELFASLRKNRFTVNDINVVSNGLNQMTPFHASEVMASIIGWALSSNDVMRELEEKYFNHLSDRNGKDKND